MLSLLQPSLLALGPLDWLKALDFMESSISYDQGQDFLLCLALVGIG